DVAARILERIDLRERGRLRTVHDVAGGADARREDAAGTLHLGRDEYLFGVVRRVVDRRHAEGEGRVGGPVLLRNDAVLPLGPVRVRVDESRDDGLARDVHDPGIARHLDGIAAAHRANPVAFDEYDAVLEHAAVRL